MDNRNSQNMRLSGRRVPAGRFHPANRSAGPILAVTDFLSLSLSVALAGGMAYFISEVVRGVDFYGFESANIHTSLLIWLVLIGGLCLWFGMTGHYTTRRAITSDLPKIWSSLIFALLVDGFVQYALRERISRTWLLSIWSLSAILLPLGRAFARSALTRMGKWKQRALIAGGRISAHPNDGLLQEDFRKSYDIVANLDISALLSLNTNVMAEEVLRVMRDARADILIAVPSPEELERFGPLMDTLNVLLVPYAIVPPLHRLPLVGLRTQTLPVSDAILMTVHRGLLAPASRATKRVFDLAVSGLLLAALTPLLLAIGFLVLCHGRPILFRHVRVGRGGVLFRCLKFRTMRALSKEQAALLASQQAQDEWAENFKLREDPRVYPFGQFLRKTSLDELPQLINVICGEMSLVGPRPVVEQEIEQYYRDDALYYFLVRPGMSGLWQVSGRNRTTYERRVQLDTWYVRNWNLWTDIVILLRTLPSIIRSRGSY